jgi:hypothetical protein
LASDAGESELSEGSASRIDPRFDPRFQRGYAPETHGESDISEVRRVVPVPALPRESAAEPAVDATAAAAEDSAPARADDTADTAPSRPVATADAELATFLDDSGAVAPARFDAWFGAGWAIAVLATVVGASLWWASIMGETYSGPVSASERWLQVVGWALAPSLVEAGLLGIVVMLVWAGVRHARQEAAA